MLKCMLFILWAMDCSISAIFIIYCNLYIKIVPKINLIGLISLLIK